MSLFQKSEDRKKNLDRLLLLLVALIAFTVLLIAQFQLVNTGLTEDWQDLIVFSAIYAFGHIYGVKHTPTIRKRWKHPIALLMILLSIAIPIGVLSWVLYYGVIDFQHSMLTRIIVITMLLSANLTVIEQVLKKRKI